MEKVLQFITDGHSVVEVVDQVRQVLEGGCSWIQLRLKKFDDDKIAEIIEHVKPMCTHHKAKLIIDDRVDMAANYKLDGVHLGFEDMSIEEARNILGEEAIIGATANTLEQIFELSQKPMSYFGIGPMRFTETKEKLMPLLGLQGYHNIVQGMQEMGITKPVVAIGGIMLDDVYDLLDLGLWGVAVGGAIAHTPNPKRTTREFMAVINNFNNR